MGPYTPDLLRRPMTPCTSSSSASSMAVPNAHTVPVNGSNHRHRDSNNGHIESHRVDASVVHSPTRIKHQIYTNNNHMMVYQHQLKAFFGQADDGSQPPSSISSADGNDWRRVKCVLVGDAAVGKTSLIVSYTTNGYPHEYVPTAFDNYTVSVRVDNQPIKLQLCDTAGQDDFDTLRPLCYPNTDVFLVCFSVVNPSSFENLKLRWIPEIRHHSTRTPFILVGTECDLRTNIKVLLDLHRHQLTPVTEAQARQFAEEVGAATYLECSSLTQQNLKETFDAAILVGLEASNLGEDGKAAPGSSIPGRKSLRKLKEKLTASRTNSVDSVKNPAFRVKNGDLTPEVQQRPVERYSTHSSASHVNARGRHNKNKLSTASVPTIGVELNAVVMNTDGIRGDQYPVGNGRDKALSPPDSETAKSRRGWRKLLCVA